MIQLHYIQRHILHQLQHSHELEFADFKEGVSVENNQLDYHIKQLIRMDYVKKDDGVYSLTEHGKSFVAKISDDDDKLIESPIVAVWLVCTKINQAGRFFLVYTRKKEPFYGCQGFRAGKIHNGETVLECAKREFKEETGLTGEPNVKAVIHYLSYSKSTGELLQDIFLYVCHFEDPSGELIPYCEGENEWVKESELSKFITKPFTSFDSCKLIVDIINDGGKKSGEGNIFFREIKDIAKDF